MAPKTRKECLFYIESTNGRVLQHCERSQWEQKRLVRAKQVRHVLLGSLRQTDPMLSTRSGSGIPRCSLGRPPNSLHKGLLASY